MTSHEIFSALKEPEVSVVLADLREGSRPSYRAALDLLAGRRRLRPAFLEKKPLDERHVWMGRELAKKSNNDVATELLQGWLFTCRKGMLTSFLDALGVPHNGEGAIESLPPEPDRTALESAVSRLLAVHPAWEVSAYLHLFCEMDIADWPVLRGVVADRPELSLASAPQ